MPGNGAVRLGTAVVLEPIAVWEWPHDGAGVEPQGRAGARSDIVEDIAVVAGPGAGSIITENQQVEHESFKIDSGAMGAEKDGQMIRSQISAATHFPQHYLGDIGSANLATATSMELPVLQAGLQPSEQIR